MSKLTYIKTFAAAIVLFIGMGSSALAQDVLVVDTAKVYVESLAGKDLQAKLTQITKTMDGELALAKNAYTQETKLRGPVLEGKTEQQIQADPTLLAAFKSLREKSVGFQQKAAILKREMAMTENVASGSFGQALLKAINTVSVQKNAKVVLQREGLLYLNDSVDVTSQVIAELNRTTPTIAVVRQKLKLKPANAAQ